MSKHICFFLGSISNGAGTERISVTLANLFVSKGYKVTIISLCQIGAPFFSVDDRIHLYSIFRKPCLYSLYYLFAVKKLRCCLKKEDVDILINVDVILAIFTIPLRFLWPKIKIISWEHFNFRTNLGVKRRDWGRKLSQKYAEAIVTLTEQDRSFYLEKMFDKSKVCTIPNFLERFPSQYANINNQSILAIGRCTNQKGFDILIKLWADIQKHEGVKGWILKIVGDGEDKASLLKLAKINRVESSIEFYPATKNIEKFYLNSSIYVMTSRYEGLPMVLLEALSYGLPIISFDCLTGPREIVKDSVNGYLINKEENAEFVNKVLSLSSDCEKRMKMQKEAINFSKNYSLNAIFSKWEMLINSL